MKKNIYYVLPLISLAPGSNIFADTPAFDRPGISFSTVIIPPGSFSFEQGFPDFQHSSDAGTKSTLYSAGTNLRIGLDETIEVQIGTALFNYLKTETSGVSDSVNGYGDSSVAIKIALPSSYKTFSWAVLGGATFATGEEPFAAEDTQYYIGTSLNLGLNETFATGFYINLIHYNGQNTYTISPNFSFSVTDTIGAYAEMGLSHTTHSPDNAVAGGGITWMITPITQLDVSADFGLNTDSIDIQGGFGISVFFK